MLVENKIIIVEFRLIYLKNYELSWKFEFLTSENSSKNIQVCTSEQNTAYTVFPQVWYSWKRVGVYQYSGTEKVLYFQITVNAYTDELLPRVTGCCRLCGSFCFGTQRDCVLPFGEFVICKM